MSINTVSYYFDPYDMDGCTDIGICREGITFNNCDDGDFCSITKENCIKNNNIWHENIRSCDVRHKIP